ncbi:MAG: hypothetical protein QME75_04215 [Deltaproteobacteria bacterium]|nr:hypothetical protein [Deltaproteobacteria bacterium]
MPQTLAFGINGKDVLTAGTTHFDSIPGYEAVIQIEPGAALPTSNYHKNNYLKLLINLNYFMLPQTEPRGKLIFSPGEINGGGKAESDLRSREQPGSSRTPRIFWFTGSGRFFININ